MTTTATQSSLLSLITSTSDLPDLTEWDVILVNSSAGKDSQAMLDFVVELADLQGVRDRIVVVHADLGRVEWAGTRELAEEQARHYGLRFEVVSRKGSIRKATKNAPEAILGDLLDQVEERHASNIAKGKDHAPWPSSEARYCTSDQKTGQVAKLITQLAAENKHLGRQVRILNCLGIRAQESAARAEKDSYHVESENTVRLVQRWLPIFTWSVDRVWDRIRRSGVRYHEAYDLGMPRLSCCFCVMGSRSSLLLAAKHNPELAQQYIEVEDRTGYAFLTDGTSMRDIVAESATFDGEVEDWECA